MPPARWNLRNELLNDFRKSVKRATRGRLSRLRVAVVDGELLVTAACASYHVVQLALKAVAEFVDDVPQMAPAKLTFSVNGRTFDVPGTGQRSRRGSLQAEPAKQLDSWQRPRRRARRKSHQLATTC